MDLESPVGAALLDNSFGRQYEPENSFGQQVEPVYSNFTAYKHEVGIYHRGRYGRFHQNVYADNFTSTFITFSQRITNSLYIGHSKGNANLSEVVTGQSLYDGPNTMDGTHFAGFNRGSSAHVFRNHGGALRNTHVYMSNTSFEDDGTKEQLSISQRYGETYNANRDAFDFQAPTAIYDVDGTLTGHGGGGAGTVLLPDNNFITDSLDVRPAGWDARISDDLYANFRIEFDGNNQGQLTLVAPDGDSSDTENLGRFAPHHPQGEQRNLHHQLPEWSVQLRRRVRDPVSHPARQHESRDDHRKQHYPIPRHCRRAPSPGESQLVQRKQQNADHPGCQPGGTGNCVGTRVLGRWR